MSVELTPLAEIRIPVEITQKQASTDVPMDDSKIRELVSRRRADVEPKVAIRAESATSLPRNGSAKSTSQVDLRQSPVSWEVPQPITSKPAAVPYPVDCLPGVFRNAIVEVQAATQAPMPMVASAAICAMATASQALFNVKRDHNLSGPTSLFFLILGDSGERKSTVDALFSREIRKFHAEEVEKGGEKLKTYRARKDAWQAKGDGLLNKIKAAGRGGRKGAENLNETDLQMQLSRHYKNEPERPLIPNLLVLDITTEKLAHQLSKEWPSCALMSAEGGQVFGGRSWAKDNQLSTFAAFNALWSDEPLRVSRKTSDSFEIHGARLSMSLSVQSGVFSSFMEKNEITRTVGLLARCLFSFPESTQGQRLYKPIPQTLPALEAFNQAVSRLLHIDPAFVGRQLAPAEISLDVEARRLWIEFHDRVELQLGRGRRLEGIRDFGSKTAENAARVAAVLQVAEEPASKVVSAKSMDAACKVVDWHLDEVVRYFGSGSAEEAKTCSDAEKLDRWLVRHCNESESAVVDFASILSRGPGNLRKKERLQKPLEYLASRHRVRLSDNGRRVEVNPALVTGVDRNE